MSAVLHRTRSTDAFIAREEVLHSGQVEFAKYCSLQEEKGIREPYNHGAAQIFIQKFSVWEEESKTKEAEQIRVKKEHTESHENPSTRSKPPRRVHVKKEMVEEQQEPTNEVPTVRRSSRLAKIKRENTQEETSADLSPKPRCSRTRKRKPPIIKKEPMENDILFDEIPVYQRPRGIGRHRDSYPDDQGDVAAVGALQQVEPIDRETQTLDEDSIPLSADRSIGSGIDGLQRSAEAAYLSTDAHCLLESCSRQGSLEHVHQESIFADFRNRCGFDAPKSYWDLYWSTALPKELVIKCFGEERATDELDLNTNIAGRDATPRPTEVEEPDDDSGIASGENSSVHCAATASLLSRQPGKLITDLDGWQPASKIERDIGTDIHEGTPFVRAPIDEFLDSTIDVELPGNCSTTASSASNETAVAKSGILLDQERWQQPPAKARETKQRLESDAMNTSFEHKNQRNGSVDIHRQSQDSFEMRRDTILAESTGSAPISEYTSENPERSMNGRDTTHLACLLRALSLQGGTQPTQSSKPDSNACSENSPAQRHPDQVANDDSCENEATGACHISESRESITKKCETRRHRLRSLHTKLFIDGRCFVSFDEAFAFCTSQWQENARRRQKKRARRLAHLEQQK